MWAWSTILTRYAPDTTRGRLRLAAHAEGLSLLLLVGVAMPVKYLLGVPQAVRVVGPVHGLLFVVYLVLLAEAVPALHTSRGPGAREVEPGIARWCIVRAAAASLIPFGTFLFLAPLLDEPAVAGDAREPGLAERRV